MTSAEVVDLLWQNPLQPGEQLARFDPCSLHAGTMELSVGARGSGGLRGTASGSEVTAQPR
jgi:hypothetical protein